MATAISAGRWRTPPFVPVPAPSRQNSSFGRGLFVSPFRRPVTAVAESGGNHMFVFGMGYVGRYVADQLKKEGWHVSGTCTSAFKKTQLLNLGFDSYVFDVHNSELGSLPTLQHATHVLVSIPPVVGLGDPLLSLHEDLRDTLSHDNLLWIGYLSSTSVYGDCGGAWVNEGCTINPITDYAKSRYAAEKGWLEIGDNLGIVINIFRLGGIYGPGRSALDTISKQKPMSKKQARREVMLYTARIHVADIYQAIKASFNTSKSGIYNVVDDDPAPRKEVFDFAQDLIKRRCPNIKIEPQPSDGMDVKLVLEKLRGEKRVSNYRMKKELGVKLRYPNYKSGLQSIIDSWGSHS